MGMESREKFGVWDAFFEVFCIARSLRPGLPIAVPAFFAYSFDDCNIERPSMRIVLLFLLLAVAACSSSVSTQPATVPAAPAPGVARFDIAPGFVQGLADERHTLPLSEWPLYQDTNLPVVRTPDQLRIHAEADPKFGGPDLGRYRVMTMRIDGQETYVFYHQDSKTLVLVTAK